MGLQTPDTFVPPVKTEAPAPAKEASLACPKCGAKLKVTEAAPEPEKLMS